MAAGFAVSVAFSGGRGPSTRCSAGEEDGLSPGNDKHVQRAHPIFKEPTRCSDRGDSGLLSYWLRPS